MVTKEIVISSNFGLHAKTANKIVRTSEKFKSLVEIEHNEKKANAKSLISVLSLGVQDGEKIKLIVSGIDECDAADAVTKTIGNL